MTLPDNGPNIDDLKLLNRNQVLITIGIVGAPVSLLIGGVPLSLAGLICSIIALTSLRKMGCANKDKGSLGRNLYIQSILAIALSSIILIANLYFFINSFIALMDAYNSGKLDSYIDAIMNGSQYSGNESNGSVWDK